MIRKIDTSLRSRSAAEAWFAVVRAYNLCDAAMSARLSELGLRVTEHEVLANLALMPGMTQQELATRCFVAKSGISMLLTRLEERELLRREADGRDQRAKRLYLTGTGETIAKQAMAIQDDIVSAMMAPLTLQEIKAMSEHSARVSEVLETLALKS
nr:MarR family winged helix-turn-helix transcriptional regulator [uncultured Rhodoferax sp.]